MKRKITIVSRESRLALTQANIVKEALQKLHPDLAIEILGITTSGDIILDQPLNKIGGKGLFVKELENCLLQKNADIAVHSMKDMPSQLPDGLSIGAILTRADPHDVLVSINNYSLSELPVGAVVGTSSLRRQAQVLAQRSDIMIKPLRGNVETRLRHLSEGKFDAIILAAAGLTRLGLSVWTTQPFSTNIMLPAVGQGALGIEYRSSDKFIHELILPLNDAITTDCIFAERAMNAKLDGGCQAPVGGFAWIENGVLHLKGLVAGVDGKIIYNAHANGDPEDAVSIGEKVADQLIAQGADQIIKQLRLAGEYE